MGTPGKMLVIYKSRDRASCAVGDWGVLTEQQSYSNVSKASERPEVVLRRTYRSSAGRCSRTRRVRVARREAQLASSKNEAKEELEYHKWRVVDDRSLPPLPPLLLRSSVMLRRRVFLSGVKIFSWHRLACSQSRAASVVVRRGVSSRSNVLASRSRRWDARSSHWRTFWFGVTAEQSERV